MAKTLVVGGDAHAPRVPFLRGILTRSLQDAGLSFDDAYALASSVRDELAETSEISTDELHNAVLKRLSERFGGAIVQRYEAPASGTMTVLVRDAKGQATPFSREQHRRHLESSGLTYEQSAAVTSKLFDHLMKSAKREISWRHLGLLTYRYLHQAVGSQAARRFLVLVDFYRGKRPIILLIGGTPGCGKSEVATEVAHRLEIARTQSTDLLREVMRQMIPERLLPVLHTSSFNAWWALPTRTRSEDDPEALLVDGYRAQADLLSVPCEAVIRRTLQEGTSLVLEGVHVQQELVSRIPKDSDAVVVFVMLAVLSPERLRERIARRGNEAHQRRAERYLENFEQIWRLQSHLLSEADRWHVPIVLNHNREQVIRDLMKTVVDRLLIDFSAAPQEVFL